MFRTNDCVPAGTFVQLIAGDVPSPGAAPGAAWLKRTGISPPSAKPCTVSTIAGAGGAAPAAGCCAAAGSAAKNPIATIVLSHEFASLSPRFRLFRDSSHFALRASRRLVRTAPGSVPRAAR